MNYQILAKLCIKLDMPNVRDENGNSVSHNWDNVCAIIDFYNSQVNCKLDLNCVEVLALLQSDDAFKITSLSVDYNHIIYDADIEETDFYICHVSSVLFDCHKDGLNLQPIQISFSMRKAVIPLIPPEKEQKNYLVFAGANRDDFQISLQYKGQFFIFQSPKDCDLLTVSSDREILQENWSFIILAYSLFQNGEITLLESHSLNRFQLYVQVPPPTGTRLCEDRDIFPLIWNWLTQDNESMHKRNIVDFFLAGTRSHGSNLDFRLINLFICMNSICGKDIFGESISKHFEVSEADGFWLSYVRNNMVHEGKSILDAIDGATSDFAKKQTRRGLKVSRFAVYSTATEKEKLPFALYCDIIDLIMAYFMKTIGYDKPIRKMCQLFRGSIKQITSHEC